MAVPELDKWSQVDIFQEVLGCVTPFHLPLFTSFWCYVWGKHVLQSNSHDSGLSLENCSDKQSASLPENFTFKFRLMSPSTNALGVMTKPKKVWNGTDFRTKERTNAGTNSFLEVMMAMKQKEIVSMLFFGRTVAKKIDINRMLTECIRGLN